MRVLLVHDFYQHTGGEDAVFYNDASLLEQHGHEVATYTRHNDDIGTMSGTRLAVETIWSSRTIREVSKVLEGFRPHVVHVHNTFPLVSPSVYYAANAARVPIVQTLHNYRLLCPAATFYRDSAVCEECLGKLIAWPAVRHACYRNSRSASAVTATMLAFHRVRRTYQKRVQRYIALSDFARDKFIAAGMPAEKIDVRPNYLLTDVGAGRGDGDFALFVGRLSSEKGVDVLLRAWELVGDHIDLRIVGDGPQSSAVRGRVGDLKGVQQVGRLSGAEVLDIMKEARFLIVPSQSYEGFPMAIAEAFSVGTPVVASRLGSLVDIVEHEKTGLLVSPTDHAELAGAIIRLASDDALAASMRKHARRQYLERYSSSAAYTLLMSIYRSALEDPDFKAASDDLDH